MLIVTKITNIVIFICKMLQLSFHATGITSLKMFNIVMEICVVGQGKSQGILSDICWEP